MKVLRTTGPSYNTRDPMPIRYYKWKCPKCGDICEDPANVHESTCHSGHEVKLQVVEDGGVHEAMVAEYQVPEFIPLWATHNYASEGGNKIHLVQVGKAKLKRKTDLKVLCGRTLILPNHGDVPEDFEKWVKTGEREVCAICLRKVRKILQ